MWTIYFDNFLCRALQLQRTGTVFRSIEHNRWNIFVVKPVHTSTVVSNLVKIMAQAQAQVRGNKETGRFLVWWGGSAMELKWDSNCSWDIQRFPCSAIWIKTITLIDPLFLHLTCWKQPAGMSPASYGRPTRDSQGSMSIHCHGQVPLLTYICPNRSVSTNKKGRCIFFLTWKGRCIDVAVLGCTGKPKRFCKKCCSLHRFMLQSLSRSQKARLIRTCIVPCCSWTYPCPLSVAKPGCRDH